MRQNSVPAPSLGQDDTSTRPPQDLDNSNGTATVINVSPANQTHLDVRIRDRYVRYTSDPASGIWRTAGDGIRELVSPFALVGIEPGRFSCAVTVIHPRTRETRLYEGDPDTIASDLNRAAARLGFRGDRKTVFWVLTEFCRAARRQAAARGAC